MLELKNIECRDAEWKCKVSDTFKGLH